MISKTHSKYIQSLQHKKFRDIESLFIAEGNKVLLELLRCDKFICTEILGTKNYFQLHEQHLRKHYQGPLLEIEEFELEKISALSTPNQVVGVFKKSIAKLDDPVDKINILLDHIQDPGNLGTIIRIADWFAVSNIICSPDCVELYNPKVVQSTMGSLGRVNVVYTNLTDWIKEHAGIKLYAAALNGKNVQTLNGVKEALIVIGNESKGISDEIMQLAKEKITITKFGEAESLNAAVATGIILSHL